MVLVVFVCAMATAFALSRMAADTTLDNTESDSSQDQPSQVKTPEQAIQQAKDYQPQTTCTQAVTPAIHEATGAQYDFPTGCIAPGWVKQEPKTIQPDS